MDGNGYIWMVVSSRKKNMRLWGSTKTRPKALWILKWLFRCRAWEKNYDLRLQNMFVFEGWGYNLAPSWYILVQSNHPCWWLRQAPASNIFKSWGKQNQPKSYWLPRYLTLLNYLNWKARFIFNVNPTWAKNIAWNLQWTTWKADIQALVPLLMVYPIDLGELAIVTTGHNMSAVTWLPVFMGSRWSQLPQF